MFAGIDTLICAGIVISVADAIVVLAAAGITSYTVNDACVRQHACDQLAADLTRLLPDTATVAANRATLKRGFDVIAAGGNGFVWNDTPPVLNTGNAPPIPPTAPGTPPILGQVPQLGVNVQGDALPAETAPCPETFPLDLVDRGSLRSAQWPNAAQQRGPVVLATRSGDAGDPWERILFKPSYSEQQVREIQQRMQNWTQATYDSVAHSIIDHTFRHGYNDNYLEYLRRADSFNRRGAQKSNLDWQTVRYNKGNGEFLIVRNGKIVSYGVNK